MRAGSTHERACWNDHHGILTYSEAEVAREGFPGLDPHEFVPRLFVDAQGKVRDAVVTRIAWRYLDDDDGDQ
ncbi:hypothetical protein [Terrabacter sp. MAHUQ-38]|uniref:hypothetical protein n=1 Tax=unclassified Terrabacter TaxID=2630222 RepID=UPI00165DE673|nr:hypothetical protein [Terrabacter sp. MAHUQ-38]MBC9820119.1 hypothetical protein [Terrabacter sp. MAHUQ-38]